MRVAGLIDSLGSGGAQRQLCLLAEGLARRGHEVALVSYHRDGFYAEQLPSSVEVVTMPPHSRWRRPPAVRRALRALRPDGVVAFLKAASFYAELAAMPERPFRLIAGERVLDVEVDWWLRTRVQFHRLAHSVVSNSFAQTKVLRRVAPFLASRLHTVLNGLDLSAFVKHSIDDARYVWREAPRLLTIGRVAPQKDGETLIRGFSAWIKAESPLATLRWYGERGTGRPGDAHHIEHARLVGLAVGLGCASQVQFYDPIRSVADLYRTADAFVLASRFEGCANVLIEAMASGLPVVASRVADNEYILDGGRCGILFDSGDPRGLSEALRRLSGLTPRGRLEMAAAARARAAALFDSDRMVEAYERLLGVESAAGGRS